MAADTACVEPPMAPYSCSPEIWTPTVPARKRVQSEQGRSTGNRQVPCLNPEQVSHPNPGENFPAEMLPSAPRLAPGGGSQVVADLSIPQLSTADPTVQPQSPVP